MAVQCTKCGEELLGAVNRCWKCGREFVPSGGQSDAPPIRRTPIDLSLVVAHWNAPPIFAEIVTSELSDDSGSDSHAATQPVETELPASSVVESVEPRRGSPFAHSHPFPEPIASPTVAPLNPSIRAQYPQHTASVGGAFAAIVLGLMSLAGAFVSAVGALLTSLMGIGLGLWGLHSTKKGFAVAGLVLCVIALALAAFFVAMMVFEMIYGYNPLHDGPIDPLDPGSNGSNFVTLQQQTELISWQELGY